MKVIGTWPINVKTVRNGVQVQCYRYGWTGMGTEGRVRAWWYRYGGTATVSHSDLLSSSLGSAP